MEFWELLENAKQYVKEEGTRQGLRNFLDDLESFGDTELQAYEILSSESSVKWSAKKVGDGEYSYYEDIYYMVEEWKDCGSILAPEWLQIDYQETWDYIRLDNAGVFGDTHEDPFVLYW